MKIALAQINPTIGDFEGNLSKIHDFLRQARAGEADLVLFPELAVSGYPCRDLLDKPEFVQANQRAVEQLVGEVEGPAVLIGHFEERDAPQGKRLANAATFIHNRQRLGTHHKILLPAYDVFDEMRYFEPGDLPVVVKFQNRRLGITVCEDIWGIPGFSDHGGYRRNPVEELKNQGVDGILNLSASPYRMGRAATRLALGKELVQRAGVPFALVNQVGGNDDLLFDGHSFALDSQGNLIARSDGFTEQLTLFSLEARETAGSAWETSEEEELYAALTMGVRDYLGKCGYQRAVVGLSGGIDSSVVAVLAREALGAAQVMGISMPSQYTASESEEDAKKLADNLGIAFETIPIGQLFEAYKAQLKPLFGDRPEDVTEENIQARIRGNLLMAVSNKMGSMVLSTGNKSEMSVGYCTLYGDMAGGLSVISDVLKTRVYRLAQWINRDREVIPQRVLTRPPTAELRPDQCDQDSLPPYEILDGILEAYIEQHCSVEEIVAKGFDPIQVQDMIAKVDQNEYKRNQAAPGLKITGKAFGSGRRIPLAQRFRKNRR